MSSTQAREQQISLSPAGEKFTLPKKEALMKERFQEILESGRYELVSNKPLVVLKKRSTD